MTDLQPFVLSPTKRADAIMADSVLVDAEADAPMSLPKTTFLPTSMRAETDQDGDQARDMEESGILAADTVKS